MKLLVCLPVTAEGTRGWLADGVLRGEQVGYAPTPGLYEAFGLTSDQDEDADYVALTVASVAALEHGRRLVAVGECEAEPNEPTDFGAVSVHDVPWSAITAFFADEPSSEAAVSAARDAVVGADLADAWDAEPVQRLVAEHDLLWHAPEEVAGLVG